MIIWSELAPLAGIDAADMKYMDFVVSQLFERGTVGVVKQKGPNRYLAEKDESINGSFK